MPEDYPSVAGAQRLTRETGFDEALIREELAFRVRRRRRDAEDPEHAQQADQECKEWRGGSENTLSPIVHELFAEDDVLAVARIDLVIAGAKG